MSNNIPPIQPAQIDRRLLQRTDTLRRTDCCQITFLLEAKVKGRYLTEQEALIQKIDSLSHFPKDQICVNCNKAFKRPHG